MDYSMNIIVQDEDHEEMLKMSLANQMDSTSMLLGSLKLKFIIVKFWDEIGIEEKQCRREFT